MPVGDSRVNDYPQGTSSAPWEATERHARMEYERECRRHDTLNKKPECQCGKSDAVLIELIKLFSTFITEVKKMSASTDALKASVAVLDGKVDALIAKPPVVVADPEAEAAVVEATASVDAIGAKIDAALAPAV